MHNARYSGAMQKPTPCGYPVTVSPQYLVINFGSYTTILSAAVELLNPL